MQAGYRSSHGLRISLPHACGLSTGFKNATRRSTSRASDGSFLMRPWSLASLFTAEERPQRRSRARRRAHSSGLSRLLRRKPKKRFPGSNRRMTTPACAISASQVSPIGSYRALSVRRTSVDLRVMIFLPSVSAQPSSATDILAELEAQSSLLSATTVSWRGSPLRVFH